MSLPFIGFCLKEIFHLTQREKHLLKLYPSLFSPQGVTSERTFIVEDYGNSISLSLYYWLLHIYVWIAIKIVRRTAFN